jgi:hypothetical protein
MSKTLAILEAEIGELRRELDTAQSERRQEFDAECDRLEGLKP